MLIKDLQSNIVRKYGTDHHDSLAISYDGTSLHYYNLQNGDGSRGYYRFVMEDGEVPKDSNTDDAKYGECYFNIGGWHKYDYFNGARAFVEYCQNKIKDASNINLEATLTENDLLELLDQFINES